MPEGKAASSTAYARLHPGVQQWIRRKRWTRLHEIQERAIPHVLEGTTDVLISAATAGGKTEAAFLPIASQVAEAWESEDVGGLSVLYISPLKALINDQYRRLADLFEPLHVPVFRWHGDVSSSKKRKARTQGGLLLITPESLEAQFIRRGHSMPAFLSPLQYVVVDELHAFIGSERGRQLQSLLHRVELAARRRIPRVALSATIGDMDVAAEYLRPGDGPDVKAVQDTSQKQSVLLQVRGYEHRPAEMSPEQRLKTGQGRVTEDEESAQTRGGGDLIDVTGHLYDTLRGGRHIVFANRRGDVEACADLLRRRCEASGVPNEFVPHHGSLGKNLRSDAERRLQDPTRPTTVVATTTLELGIDVGTVESIAQIGPPPSVASMRQRLGRSGRRDSPAVLRIYIRESEVTAQSSLVDRLRTGLVRTLAMVELLLERWYEPPLAEALHLSTLVQQVLSLIAQHGGINAAQAYDALCKRGPFRPVSSAMFARLLRDLGAAELITQMHDGTLIVDLKGERLINHYDFYAAFSTPDEYRLVTQGKTLGSLPIVSPLYEGAYLIFGGTRWEVTGVDQDEKVVELMPAKGGTVPLFGGMGALVHDTVRETMEKVYQSSHEPTFANSGALNLLRQARRAYHDLDFDQQRVVQDGRDAYWLPWVGDRKLNTMLLALRRSGLDIETMGPFLKASECSPTDLQAALQQLGPIEKEDLSALAMLVQNKQIEKHHLYLRDELLAADYASQYLERLTERY